jgi:hypothetical protein
VRAFPRPGDPDLKGRLEALAVWCGPRPTLAVGFAARAWGPCALLGLAVTVALALAGCASEPPPRHVAPRPAPRLVSARPPPAEAKAPRDPAEVEIDARLRAGVEYGPWLSLGKYVSYMVPTGSFIAADGTVDVAFHFHGGEVADKDWRQGGLNAVIVNETFSKWGSVPYKRAVADPVRFGETLDEVLRKVGAKRVRRLALVSWSAGYAAVERVLKNDHYYALADTVVIIDGLHADFVRGKPDERPILIFERFARDAAAGRKTMVVVHSSIIPPNYASTTQMAELLCASVPVERVFEEKTNTSGMTEWYHADKGGLHVGGFRGIGPKDHLDQVHLLDDLVRGYITPRWTRLAVEEALRPPEPEIAE